jgi:hypothetical protein
MQSREIQGNQVSSNTVDVRTRDVEGQIKARNYGEFGGFRRLRRLRSGEIHASVLSASSCVCVCVNGVILGLLLN